MHTLKESRMTPCDTLFENPMSTIWITTNFLTTFFILGIGHFLRRYNNLINSELQRTLIAEKTKELQIKPALA